jgi:hypothetical protein
MLKFSNIYSFLKKRNKINKIQNQALSEYLFLKKVKKNY